MLCLCCAGVHPSRPGCSPMCTHGESLYSWFLMMGKVEMGCLYIKHNKQTSISFQYHHHIHHNTQSQHVPMCCATHLVLCRHTQTPCVVPKPKSPLRQRWPGLLVKLIILLIYPEKKSFFCADTTHVLFVLCWCVPSPDGVPANVCPWWKS